MPIYRRADAAIPSGDSIPYRGDGDFHLFHLSSPPNTTHFPERVRTTWQHARSKDLVNWTVLPPALEAGEGAEPDANGAWTGSVIEAGGVFHIFYTGHKLGSATPQTICHATSADGVTFNKTASNPILLPDTSLYESIDWRDPYVFWNGDEHCYWMLVAARLNKGPKWRRGCIALATSKDLVKWSLDPEPFYQPMTTFCPECPELFKLGKFWYLIYSRFSERVGTVYRISESSRGPWRVPANEALDGRRWYASKSLSSEPNTRVFFGWVHDRVGESDTGAWLWGGDFAAPREVTPDESGDLKVRLPVALCEEYSATIAWTRASKDAKDERSHAASNAIALSAVRKLDWRFIDVEETAYLFQCRLSGYGTAASFGLLFRVDDDLGGYAIEFDRNLGTVALVHWPQPLDTFWAALVGRSDEVREVDGPRLVERRFDLASQQPIECKLLVSGSILELFINDTIALSYRVYSRAPHELGLFVEDGSLTADQISLKSNPKSRKSN
jgi:beta-fructofuranosidase